MWFIDPLVQRKLWVLKCSMSCPWWFPKIWTIKLKLFTTISWYHGGAQKDFLGWLVQIHGPIRGSISTQPLKLVVISTWNVPQIALTIPEGKKERKSTVFTAPTMIHPPKFFAKIVPPKQTAQRSPDRLWSLNKWPSSMIFCRLYMTPGKIPA